MKLTVFEDLDEARDIWSRLQDAGVCSYFQMHQWLSAWQDHVGQPMAVRPRVVVVSNSDDEPLALLPLGLQVTRVGTALRWLGGETSAYLGPVLRVPALANFDMQTLDRIFDALPGHGVQADYVDLDRQPAMFGEHCNPFANYRSEPNGMQCHITRLAGDWATYYAEKRSSRTRHKDRNRLRQLERHGDVAFEIASSPADINALMDRLILEKSRQFRKLGVKNVFETDGVASLFRDVALGSLGDGSVRLFAITLNGDPIAISYNVIHRSEIHGVFLCYADNAVTRLGPGTLLLHRVFAWCFANGITSFDFSLGDQDYKRQWCETTNPLYRSLWPITRKGAMHVQSIRAARSLRSAVKSSPALSTLARRLVKAG